MPAQRFFNALPVVIQIGDLILTILYADALGYLRPRLDDASNFMQDR